MRPRENGSQHREDVIVEIIEALAEAEIVSPEEIDYVLYEYIDPEILTKLATSDGGTWAFEFAVADHRLKLTSDGELFVDGIRYRNDCLSDR